MVAFKVVPEKWGGGGGVFAYKVGRSKSFNCIIHNYKYYSVVHS